MTPSGIITFTTDFGQNSTYVGQMKGAALAIHADLQLVDLCHEVPPQQIATGAYLLETGYGAFPAGSVHVAVVDPGVGTAREALAVRAGDHYFLAPDNGLLTRVLERERLAEAYLIRSEEYLRQPRAATFEGRDLFAPAAAWIAGGLELRRLGPAAGELIKLPINRPSLKRGTTLEVPVLHVDEFGNVALDLHRDVLSQALESAWSLSLETPTATLSAFHRTYGDAPAGGPFLLINSAGYLEVAIRDGHAAEALALRPGMKALLIAGA